MSIGRLNFDDINEGDIKSLITTGIAEGPLIDFKEASYGRTDNDVREFLKDVSAFANTSGGHLLIGVKEVEGVASEIVPLTLADPDAEILRLENLLRDGLEPRIVGARIRWVSVPGGGVIVVRVPRSWQPPHRVSIRNTNRFYVRNSGGVHEASVHELRTMFSAGSTAMEQCLRFRHERLAKVEAGEAPVALAADNGRTYIHIVPLAASGGLGEVSLEDCERDLNSLIPPRSGSGFNITFNFEGLVAYCGGDQCFGYVQQFRNGCIEAVQSGAVMERHGKKIIPAVDFSNFIFGKLPLYLNGLKRRDVVPPLIAMVTLTGVERAALGVHASWGFMEPQLIRHSVLELPPTIIEDYGSTEHYQKLLRPAFDALWNAGGYPRCTYYREDGSFVAG